MCEIGLKLTVLAIKTGITMDIALFLLKIFNFQVVSVIVCVISMVYATVPSCGVAYIFLIMTNSSFLS